MSNKFDPSDKNKLDNEWRRKTLPPFETLQELGLTENDIVADIGCGIGYFTISAAEILKLKNKVYALDTSEEMLLEVEKRAKFSDVKNVITLNTGEYDLKLPIKMISFSLLVNVLHEIEDRERFINEIKRITKPNGKIAIIEWEKKQTEMGPSVEHRIDKNDAKILLKNLGFEITKETTFFDCFYGVVGIMK